MIDEIIGRVYVNGRLSGTGFVIQPRHSLIVTAYHVIGSSDVAGVSFQRSADPEPISIARLIGFRPTETGDIALLQLASPLPATLRVPALATRLDPPIDFSSTGFDIESGEGDYRSASGEISGPMKYREEVPLLQAHTTRIWRGMSGSPVFVHGKHSKRIAGMLIRRGNKTTGTEGLAAIVPAFYFHLLDPRIDIDLTEYANLPIVPEDEVARDNHVKRIASDFNAKCQCQLVSGVDGAGKSNLLSQFARHYSSRSISYFVSNDPRTQRLTTFLYDMCMQMAAALGETSPVDVLTLEELNNWYTALNRNLRQSAKRSGEPYFFVIDGLEWALEGDEGEAIVYSLPDTHADGLYLLLSCTNKHRLPQWLEVSQIGSPWPFSQQDTERYLQNTGFTREEISQIHLAHNGLPGSLKLVKEAKKTDPNFDLESALQERRRLVEGRVEFVFNEDATLRPALELAAIAPTSLPAFVIGDMLGIAQEDLLVRLQRTGLVVWNVDEERIVFEDELVRSVIREKVGERKSELASQLLQYVREKSSTDEFLLTLLHREAQDYEGLRNMLAPELALATVQSPQGGISSLVKRLRIAIEMAEEREDTADLLSWILGIAGAKSFIEDSINEDEIEALIALGDFSRAKKKAFALREPIAQVRQLARIYTSMKRADEHVSKQSRTELKMMVEKLNVADFDKEDIKKVALDLFPILPDEAICLVESVVVHGEPESVLDLVLSGMLEEVQSKAGEVPEASSEKRDNIFLPSNFVSWLVDKSIDVLLDNLDVIETTKAKEQLIRSWCLQNSNSSELGEGIELWLNTVTDDRTFVVPLRNIRQISRLVIHVPQDIRKFFVERLEITRITSITTPHEEWFRTRLNLAEAQSTLDPDAALVNVRNIHEDIQHAPLDLDVKSFCLARLLSSVSRCFPEEIELRDQVDRQFHKEWEELLKNSAEQYELLEDTLTTIVHYDISRALAMSMYLNTEMRRNQALSRVLRESLKIHGEQAITKFIEDAVEELPKRYRDAVLATLVEHLRVQSNLLHEANVRTLVSYARQVVDPTLRAASLANLAVLLSQIPGVKDETYTLLQEAEEAWETEEDLKVRIVAGFDLIVTASEINRDFSENLFHKVKALELSPGAALALGKLGSLYVAIIELAIRALGKRELSSEGATIEIQRLIAAVPSRVMRSALYARLASCAFRSDSVQIGNEIVRTRLLREIESIVAESDKQNAIVDALPVIAEYDPLPAEELAQTLPEPQASYAWYMSVIWLLSDTLLGDHRLIDPHNLRAAKTRITLQRATELVKRITPDYLLGFAIQAVVNCIGASFDEMIDLTQALNFLHDLEEVAENRLPDPHNINKHDGYKIWIRAIIHGERSNIVSRNRYRRGHTRSELRDGWKSLCTRAENIPNVADRVFVMSQVALQMNKFYGGGSKPKEFLDKAYQQIVQIPTILDRLDRLEVVAEVWSDLREVTRSQFLLEEALRLARQLEETSIDERLEKIVQLAYKTVGPDFAAQLVSQLDNARLPSGTTTRSNRILQSERLRATPELISEIKGLKHERTDIVAETAKKLLEDLVLEKGRGVPHSSVMNEWLVRSASLSISAMIRVAHWVVESKRRSSDADFDFQWLAVLINELAIYLALVEQEIPPMIEGSFLSLSDRSRQFKAGATEQAVYWVTQWLKQNVEDEISICDPYFGLEQLEFFTAVPEGCRIVILTTDAGIPQEITDDDILYYWNHSIAKGNISIPQIMLMVVPHQYQDYFRQHLITCSRNGLDIGPSLYKLQSQDVTITVLSQEDVAEMRESYLTEMFNTASWLLKYGVAPKFISVDKQAASSKNSDP